MIGRASYPARYAQERDRLLAALGQITTGGILEGVQHIGGTSVPGLLASPCLDIGLAAWPFPLEAQQQQMLQDLGYQQVPGFENAPEQRWQHGTGEVQLFIAEPGSEQWSNYLLLRDYLSSETDARQNYNVQKSSLAPGDPTARESLFRAKLIEAQRWWAVHYGFSPLDLVSGELKVYSHPWYISGGWALDLFLGSVHRVHHDIDVVIPRSDQLALQAHMLACGWLFVTPFEKRLEPWPPHMFLELPRHQAHAHRGEAFIDFLLTDIDDQLWRYRRNPTIIRSRERMSLVTPGGLPFLAPELVLLFKSKNTSGKERKKDQDDFERVHPHLEAERRAWLYWALAATDPEHPWLRMLV